MNKTIATQTLFTGTEFNVKNDVKQTRIHVLVFPVKFPYDRHTSTKCSWDAEKAAKIQLSDNWYSTISIYTYLRWQHHVLNTLYAAQNIYRLDN